MLLIQEHRWPAVPRIGFQPLYWNGRRSISEFWSRRGSSTRFSVKSSALGSATYAVPILIALS